MRPIKIYGKEGPNPVKPAMILRALKIPHEIEEIPFSEVKKPEYVAINPNGRLPAIHDPNTNLTLWESGAIIEYLIEKYDVEHKLSYPSGTNEAQLCKQWLFYQVSGQGPYFGQAVWFKIYHPEQVPSALERYVKEVNRVTAVLESHLSKQEKGNDGPWLVGDKMTYADIAFLSWQRIVTWRIKPEDGYNPDDHPVVKEWLAKIEASDGVAGVLPLEAQ